MNKICFKYFLGMGNHHARIRPVKLQRNPLMSIGGNCSIPGFVITKPTPHNNGTEMAKIKSRTGINEKSIYSLKKEGCKFEPQISYY
jgi:hypothetical protein